MAVDTAELTAAITGRGGARFGEVGEGTSRRGLMLQYWKKCARPGCPKHINRHTGKVEDAGWITVGPSMSDPLRHAQYLNEKHMTPLPQYGVQAPGPSSPMLQNGLRFESIVSQGGIHEFPVDQIQALGWDMIPAVREVRPDCILDRLWCGDCYGRSFVSRESLAAHASIMHKDVAPARAIGNEIKNAVEVVQKANDPTALAAAIISALYQMQNLQGEGRIPVPAMPVMPPPPPGNAYEQAEENVAQAMDFDEEFKDVRSARRAQRG